MSQKFFNENKNSTAPSFSNLTSFTGLIHILDKENELFFAKKVENGIVVDNYMFADVDTSSPSARMEIDCYTVATNHYIDWYANGSYVDSYLQNITYETECYSFYLPELSLEGGGGGGTYGSTGGGAYDNCIDPRHGCIYDIDDSFENLVVVSPDKPIASMTDYLECLDLTKSATITIYVDQPKSGSSDAYALSLDGVVVGHTYVSIKQGSNTSVFGFYPSTDETTTNSPPEPSAMGDDSGESFDASISILVSGTVLQRVLQYSINYPIKYDLDNYNCSDFGINIGNLAGLGLSDSYGTWPGGGGSNPGSLGEHIRSRVSSGNVIVNKIAGKSPYNSKSCSTTPSDI